MMEYYLFNLNWKIVSFWEEANGSIYKGEISRGEVCFNYSKIEIHEKGHH